MRIPDQYLKSVVFVGIKITPDEKEPIKWRGTAFCITMPTRIPGKSFGFLVTARHVIAEIGKQPFYLRFNGKDGQAKIIGVSPDISWFYHPNMVKSCDVAVYPMTLGKDDIDTLDFSAISVNDFATEEIRIANDIGPDDEVFTMGLFSPFSGQSRNFPILRMGTIAMMPGELVPTSKFGNMEVYLIESKSIGGLSGSPVGVVKQTEPGKYHSFLLGLVHGHWEVDHDKTQITSRGVNSGIAMVTPAKFIVETLKRPELEKYRQDIESKWGIH